MKRKYEPPTVVTIDANDFPVECARMMADKVVDQQLAALLRTLADKIEELDRHSDDRVAHGLLPPSALAESHVCLDVEVRK